MLCLSGTVDTNDLMAMRRSISRYDTGTSLGIDIPGV